MEWEIGAPGKAYTKWAAQMAVGLDTGVPWVMCKQEDAPDPVVSYFFFILKNVFVWGVGFQDDFLTFFLRDSYSILLNLSDPFKNGGGVYKQCYGCFGWDKVVAFTIPCYFCYSLISPFDPFLCVCFIFIWRKVLWPITRFYSLHFSLASFGSFISAVVDLLLSLFLFLNFFC